MRIEWTNVWIVVAVGVAVLLILSGIESVRAWFGRVVSPSIPKFSLPSLGGLGGALAGVVGQNWLRLSILAGLAAALPLTCMYIEGRGADRERIKTERANTAVAEHEADLARKAGELGIETTRERARRETVIAEAQQDLSHAVEAGDFEALYAEYLGAHCRLLPYPGCPDRADPAPGGTERMRSPGAHAA